MTQEKRICKIHGMQPISDFYYNQNGSRKYYKCKLCTKANVKRNEQKSDNMVQRHRKYRQEWKMKVFQHYSKSETPFCECCGETIFEFLTLDHKFGDGTKHRKEVGKGRLAGGCRMYKWAIDNDYPDIFRILCYNCNCAYGVYGRCPHQDHTAPVSLTTT